MTTPATTATTPVAVVVPTKPILRGVREGCALTAREIDVIRYLPAGYTNADIGSELYLSIDTVKTHLRRVAIKLGARDRTQILAIAYQRGIVPMPPGSTPVVAGQTVTAAAS